MQKIHQLKKTKSFLVPPLKPSYMYIWRGECIEFYRNPAFQGDGCRSFSTKQERSMAFMHEIEYAEYGLKVRPHRGNNLVDAWDDLYCHFNSTTKSWKHNSKRRHQYYRQKDNQNF